MLSAILSTFRCNRSLSGMVFVIQPVLLFPGIILNSQPRKWMCFLRTSVISVFSVDNVSFNLLYKKVCSLAFHCLAWARVSVMMTKSSAYRTSHPGVSEVLYSAFRLFPGDAQSWVVLLCSHCLVTHSSIMSKQALANNGLMIPPCGVPNSFTVHSSIIPAFSIALIICSTRLSLIPIWYRRFNKILWSILSKHLLMSPSTIQYFS